MPSYTDQLQSLMEQASQALADMDYLACEDLCLQALDIARKNEDWPDYARVLLPLQESRRQRRVIAAEGTIRLGTSDLPPDLPPDPITWLGNLQIGCVLVTHPHSAQTARQLVENARRQHLYIEVLFADNPSSASNWELTSFAGPQVRCTIAAPPASWRDRWISPNQLPLSDTATNGGSPGDSQSMQPADWFLDACESLGDAALNQVKLVLGDPRRVDDLQQCLEVVTDHEIIHQRLYDAAVATKHPPT